MGQNQRPWSYLSEQMHKIPTACFPSQAQISQSDIEKLAENSNKSAKNYMRLNCATQNSR